MLIQWCLKGIREQPTFGDPEAQAVLRDVGLSSSWLRTPVGRDIRTFPPDSHWALSQAALNAHVNGFASAAATTPYISLSAGCVELDPATATTTVYPALDTALEFATDSGRCDGYVFRMWVLVSPKPGPELPGFAEEVRELNLFRQFALYHYEGEIAAKLFIPARHIEWAIKYDRGLRQINRWNNPGFVPPQRISNVLDVL